MPLDRSLLSTLAQLSENLQTELMALEPGRPLAEYSATARRLVFALLLAGYCDQRTPAQGRSIKGCLHTAAADLHPDLTAILEGYNQRFQIRLFTTAQTERLKLPELVLAGLLAELCRHAGELELEDLGRVYEQLICAPVAKQDGAFYTPIVLTRQIVAAALEPLVSGLMPPKLLQLRILDPACGSGIFLLETYRWLLAYWQAVAPEVAPDPMQLMEHCLYGVDCY